MRGRHRGGRPSPPLPRPLICATRGMRLNLLRRPVDYIDSAAVAFPAGDASGEVFVGVGDAAVVFFFELVFYGVRGGVTPLPESFDEVIALLVIRELLEGGALFVRNDVGYVFIKTFFETAADFLLEALLVFLPLLLRQWSFEGIGFLILRLGRCRTGLARTVGLGVLR